MGSLFKSAQALARRLDPCEDPAAEPLSLLAVFVVLFFSCMSAFFFLRWKIQPMQDLGHHLAMTAVVADYSRADSIYPAIYKPFDFLNTNSLFYSFAGYSGKWIGASLAFRLWSASYLVAVPLANLWALRTFGRSAWGAVVAVPLSYNLSYVFGFINFLFAAPLAILALPMFYRMLRKATRGRVAAVAIVMVLLFLAHVHVFLWTGVLLFAMTLGAALAALRGTLFGVPGPRVWTVVWTSALSVAPALALLGRWMLRSRQPPAPDEFVTFLMAPLDWATFKAAIPPVSQLIGNLHGTMSLMKVPEDAVFLVGLVALGLSSVALARLHRFRDPPVMEIACLLTFVSYFFLPENAAGQAVIGSRQVGFAMWFAPAFFSPVPNRVSPLARWSLIGGLCSLTVFFLSYWGSYLQRFQKLEVAGFEEVIGAAPPQKRMHYVNNAPGSAFFPLNTFWHVEKWYMIDKRGQCNENPAYGSMNSIRYRKSYAPNRPTNHSGTWVYDEEIWNYADIILTHHFSPTPQQLAVANEKGELLASKGTWQLWRSRRRAP